MHEWQEVRLRFFDTCFIVHTLVTLWNGMGLSSVTHDIFNTMICSPKTRWESTKISSFAKQISPEATPKRW